MKVIYIDQTGQLGGGELSLLDWLTASPQDSSVILLSDGPFRELLESIGIPVKIVPIDIVGQIRRGASFWNLFSVLPNLFRLRKRLSEAIASVDLLYANSQKAFLLVAFSKRPTQPLIWHLRDLFTADHFSPFIMRLAVFVGNRFASLIIVNSQATGDAFVAAGGNRAKLRLVPDGIDPRPFDGVDPATVTQLRQEICPRDTFLIGLFGRLAFWKGQHVLLEAGATMPDVQICLVGDALFGESSYADGLRVRASQADLAHRVHFLGFRRDIPELMHCMDLVVHTSVSPEPLGRVILEGMLARKPVIATQAGGAAEIVVAGESGLLVEPGSVEELRDAIIRLQSDPELSQRLAASGRIRAELFYSLQSMVDQTREVLREAGMGQNAGLKTEGPHDKRA